MQSRPRTLSTSRPASLSNTKISCEWPSLVWDGARHASLQNTYVRDWSQLLDRALGVPLINLRMHVGSL